MDCMHIFIYNILYNVFLYITKPLSNSFHVANVYHLSLVIKPKTYYFNHSFHKSQGKTV